MKKTRSLGVFINGERVGIYSKTQRGEEFFTFDETWLEHGYPISRSLPFREGKIYANKIIPVFDNLLPDSYRDRSRIAENERAEGTDTFSLLEVIGEDCVGAFQFLPPGKEPVRPWKVESQKITEKEVSELIGNLKRSPLGRKDGKQIKKSMAGQHSKTSLIKRDGNWYIPIGTSPSTHILKPQSGLDNPYFNLDENEYFCMTLAKNIGLEVAQVDYTKFDGKSCLVIERFDRDIRDDGESIYRIHQEDFCQALGRGNSAKRPAKDETGLMDSCFDVINELNAPEKENMKFISNQIFQWLSGAEDGHLKNFSYFLSGGRRGSMTPFYDISSADPYDKNNPKAIGKNPNFPGRSPRLNVTPELAIPLAGTEKTRMSDICAEDFIQLADYGYATRESIKSLIKAYIETIEVTVEETIEETQDVVPAYIYGPIKHGIQTRVKKISQEMTEK